MDTEEPNNAFFKLEERVEPRSDKRDAPNKANTIKHSESLFKETRAYSTIEKVRNVIRQNIQGCDFLICVFVAALNSYRAETCLRPYPQCFVSENNEKDFISLKSLCSRIPPLREFMELPVTSISEDAIKLLKWIFVDVGLPVLRSKSVDHLPLPVINKKARINELPQYVFEVNYPSKIEETWEKRIGGRDIFYAFHGSSVSNFYSILKFGLQHHFNKKEVIFGAGIYLSNEISVCTNYSPFGETWKNSILGFKHSIIAVCEVINDEEDVKCKDEKNKRRSINQNSYGEIPEKYFVVTNSELVKVKYLLVYGYKSPSVVKSFIKDNIHWILITLYFVMLVLIGFMQGPTWRKFLNYLYALLV